MSHLIDSGTFSPGDRIPSVRSLNRQMRVSIATVMEAYRLLEDRGLIECRPQSGYYVLSTTPGKDSEIELSSPSFRPARVSVSDLVMMILKDSGNPNLFSLALQSPIPSCCRSTGSTGQWRR